MSYEFYKTVHLFGVFLVLTSLMAALMVGEASQPIPDTARKRIAMTHGIGLLIALVAAFGTLAKMPGSMAGGLPLWVSFKLVLWLLLGAGIAIVKRLRTQRVLLSWIIPLFGALGAWIAITKP